MGNAVDQLYNKNLGPDPSLPISSLLARTLDVRGDLDKWCCGLPPMLTILTLLELEREDALPPVEILRLRVFLTLRYRSVEILVLRSCLRHYLDFDPELASAKHEVALLRGVGLSIVRQCAESSIELIDMIERLLLPFDRFGDTLHGAWWFNTYYSGFRHAVEEL